MRVVQAPRASAILYQVLMGQQVKRTWLLPANICPIVPVTFMKAGVPFELVDISAASLHMDLEQAEARIRQGKVGGLLYAHTYGEESTPYEFFDHIKSLHPDLLIMDDRCLCVPRFEDSSSADVVMYSTGYAKVVDLGFGGYAFMKADIVYQPVRLMYDDLQLDELEKSYKSAIQGRNRYVYRDGDWLETATAQPFWDDFRWTIESELELALAHRSKVNAIYSSRLPPHIQLRSGYQIWRFNIRVHNKKSLLESIFKAGLFASSHYASLAGVMSDGTAPEAGSLADNVVNLFNDHHFDEDKVEKVCSLILGNRGNWY